MPPVFKPHKLVNALPTTLEASSVYFVKVGAGFDLYVTNETGTIVAYEPNLKSYTKTESDSLANSARDAAISAIRNGVAAAGDTLLKVYALITDHTGRTDNPHSTTAAQVGADTSGQVTTKINNAVVALRDGVATAGDTLAKIYALITNHTARTDNPHATTAAQVGADTSAQTTTKADGARDSAISTIRDAVATAGDTLAKVYALIINHTGRTDNPHGVTAAQAGAAPVAHTHTTAQITDIPTPTSANRYSVLALNAAGTAYELTRHFSQTEVIALGSTSLTIGEDAVGRTYVNRTTAARTVVLPATAPFIGWTVTFERQSTGSITINPNGLSMNGGTANFVMNDPSVAGNSGTHFTKVDVYYDGAGYRTIQGNLGFVPVQSGGGTAMTGNRIFLGWDGSNARFQVDTTSRVITTTAPSDEGMKENITDAEANALDLIKRLRFVAFNYKPGQMGLDSSKRFKVGFSAQELEKIEPLWIIPKADPTDALVPNHQVLLPYAMYAIQILEKRVADLEKKLLSVKV